MIAAAGVRRQLQRPLVDGAAGHAGEAFPAEGVLDTAHGLVAAHQVLWKRADGKDAGRGIGIDYSQESLCAARKLLDKFGLGQQANFIAANAMALPFKAEFLIRLYALILLSI